MFQWFKQMSVTTRLRGFALMAVVAMLALCSTLLWTGYKQRLADRQAADAQRIELAHASVQWAYARQQFGKLNATQARQKTLAVLERLKRGQPLDTKADDVHASVLSQTAVTLTAIALVSTLLWACIEITARDLKRPAAQPEPMARERAPARGPLAYRQGPVPPTQAAMHKDAAHADLLADAASDDPTEAAQEVKRLRMAGAI
jgi:peptidoglycan/LPS O-acetylase OafA/YrhL